jgi:3-hydroxyisobutyrate dehydrogenase
MADERRRIAWIGAGVMGAAMAGHILKAGHALTIHSRTKPKAQPLLESGATWADSPAKAADGAEMCFSIVGYPEDVRAVHLGERGTLRAARPPALIIDMTTSRPALAVEIAEHARQLGVGGFDAPVSGGDVGARNAALSIMVGGEAPHVEQAHPLLALLGKSIVHHGPPGAGQHAKMVNQILIATNMIGVCEGMLYARKAGLDPLKVIESVGGGAAGSWSINNLGPRMIRRDFEPGFFVEHFIKDLQIALDEAAKMNLALPGLALARQLYEAVRAQGHARRGTQALLLALESLNNMGEQA